MIKYKLKTAPTLVPVTLAEVKSHLRISFADQDTMIQTYIDAAVDFVENYTGRKLMTQTWSLVCDNWLEATEAIKFGQLQSVTSVKYLDEDQVSQTVSPDDYIVSGVGTDSGSVVFHLDGDFDYPAVFEVEPITIEFVSGYDLLVDSALPNIIPQAIKTAIKLKVSELYAGECTGYIVLLLCQPYRLWSF